jgi:glutathione synthase/RimK-type ligase-like ATP-grasp enzyme
MKGSSSFHSELKEMCNAFQGLRRNMSIVILAPLNDNHANCIEYGLTQAGCEVVRWEGLGWQQGRDATLDFGLHDRVYLGEHRITDEDTIWFRRMSQITCDPKLDAGELKYSRAENRSFYDTLLYNLELTGARCINKWTAARLIENKSIQLSIASSAGMKVPKTCMTNSRRSLEDRAFTSAVHKSFSPHGWVDQQALEAVTCEAVYIRDLLNYEEEMFSSTPGIYQTAIDKKCDARVFMMDRNFYGYLIDTSQAELDCRAALSKAEAVLSIMEISTELTLQLSRFADQAHLSFACFDLCRDAEGEWWFLEVNQAGQFLFVDDMLPTSGLYHRMLHFLAGSKISGAEFPLYLEAKEACATEDAFISITEETRYATLV